MEADALVEADALDPVFLDISGGGHTRRRVGANIAARPASESDCQYWAPLPHRHHTYTHVRMHTFLEKVSPSFFLSFSHTHTHWQVVCGCSHTLVMTAQSHVFAWGDNTHGQLGMGDTKDRPTPMLVDALWALPVVQVRGGVLVVPLSASASALLVMHACGDSQTDSTD